ncbi:MAG: HAMP domain-containing sensor histidine kinase [Gemmatimonadota bacterium]|nr:HAMP domain-containing sensor histidine kinase [Gemmatimonadota bacterium]
MASIRSRVTAAYALALFGTMLAFAAALWTARRAAVLRDLQVRVSTLADIGHLVLTQAGTQNNPVVVDTTNAAREPELQPLLRARLDAVPEYLVVADSTRALYMSAPVRDLAPDDLDALLRASMLLTEERHVATVRLSSDKLLLVARFEHGEAGPVRRVVAASSVASADFIGSEQFGVFVLIAPLVILLSVIVAFLITGRALAPVDEIIREMSAITDGRSLHRRLPQAEGDDELARLSATLNAMIARLEQSFAGLRRFTADASHELKTPLTVLRADIERAMSAGPRSTEGLIALEEALQETTRMADLVESLLTLARADEGRFDLHREPVEMRPLVLDVAETAQILGEDADLRVTVGPLEDTTVMGDPLRLRQLFLNLVTNAVKYTSRGGRVDLTLVRRGDLVEFAVSDTGIGIAGADLPYVFDRFWRADRVRSRQSERGGMGLGLSISQWIAHAHGGSITVASRLGRGSTFTVGLPVAVVVPAPPDAVPARPVGDGES